VSGLVCGALAEHGDGHHRLGHPHQRVDRRAGGRIAVPSGIGRGEPRRASGEREIVQRSQDTVGYRWRAGATSMARSASSD
jgi:hypothetical protein